MNVDPVGRLVLAAAGFVWLMMLAASWHPAAGVAVGAAVAGFAALKSLEQSGLWAFLGAIALIASFLPRAIPPPLEETFEVEVVGALRGDVRFGGAELDLQSVRRGHAWHDIDAVVTLSNAPTAARGEVVVVQGTLEDGQLAVSRLERVDRGSVLDRTANSARRHIRTQLGRVGDASAAGLLSGLLIGDTEGVAPDDLDALRRAGLSHFVAVSGSNLGLFLLAWWLLLGPLAIGTWNRVVLGLAGIVFFAVLTRGEPSVIRASVTAGFLLVTRALGVPLSGWSLLGGAVLASLLVAPGLASAVGFQLSVAATLGVLAASARSAGMGRVLTALSMTTWAQLAVAPVLLLHFGAMPLVAPLANLVAAPLVVGATATAAAAVVSGNGVALALAEQAAGAIYHVAELASGWPQLSGVTAWALFAAGVAALGFRNRFALAAAIVVLFVGIVVPHAPPRPSVVFFDVGQGDSVLVLGASAAVLIDGGPDRHQMSDELRRLGIRALDAVVASHTHEDHVAGLVRIVEEMKVGVLVHPGFADPTTTMVQLLEIARARGIEIEIAEAGGRLVVGDLTFDVLGPRRRYASANDQSVVLRLDTRPSFLFAGDIETYAQADIGPVRADVLKVPHQGAATSTEGWLKSVQPKLAIISVGPNSFGHPSPHVVDVLEEAGARVMRTDRDGDIRVAFRD